jgi:hypothetical protein
MPDDPDVPTGDAGPVVTASPGLAALLAEAQRTWVGRARDEGAADKRCLADPAQVLAHEPGWRPFEDAFPTFYQFTNRPR